MHRALLIISVLSILILSCGNDLLNVELSEREIEIIQDCKANTITSTEELRVKLVGVLGIICHIMYGNIVSS